MPILKKIHLILFTLFSLCSYSQKKFEKAYFIDNNNVKTECFIDNEDWINNPTEFNFKLTENDNAKTKRINEVKEFAIVNASKYVRSESNIDLSSVDVQKLSNKFLPEWSKKTIFLEVLVEGNANLYAYVDGNMRLYFYKTDKDIEQLIYKKYLSEDLRFRINNEFVVQLFKNVNCKEISFEKIGKIEYKRKQLVNHFIEHNSCKGDVTTEINKKKSSFNFKLIAGMNSASLKVDQVSGEYTQDYGNKSNAIFGFEGEYFFPSRKNRWSLFLDASHQSFSSEANFKVMNYPFVLQKRWEVDYSYINTVVGLRYYASLSPKSKVFFNFGGSANVPIKKELKNAEREGIDNSLDITTKPTVSFGLGYIYNSRFSVSLNLSSSDILVNYYYWKSQYTNLTLAFGYTIFDNNNKYHKK